MLMIFMADNLKRTPCLIVTLARAYQVQVIIERTEEVRVSGLYRGAAGRAALAGTA
jgi:hypothetical protein